MLSSCWAADVFIDSGTNKKHFSLVLSLQNLEDMALNG